MKIVLKGTVTLSGHDVHAGDVIDIPEDSAKSLVAADLAENVGGKEQNGTPDEFKAGDGTDGAEEALAKLMKALDNQYKRDELAVVAKTAGVEFEYDAKKAEIITAVIEQGKEATLLK